MKLSNNSQTYSGSTVRDTSSYKALAAEQPASNVGSGVSGAGIADFIPCH